MMYRIINGLVAILNHHHSCICRYSTLQQNNCTQSPSFHPQSGYGTNYQKPQQQPWTWNPSKRKSRQSDSNTADLVFNCIVSPLRKHGCFKLSVKMLLLQPCTLMEEEEEKIYRIFFSHGTLWCMIQSKTKNHSHMSAENAFRTLSNEMTVNVKWNFGHIFYEYLLFSTF
jgi:hypothetical protein